MRWRCSLVGVSSVVAIFGVQGWRWDWVRNVRELVPLLLPGKPHGGGSASPCWSPQPMGGTKM